MAYTTMASKTTVASLQNELAELKAMISALTQAKTQTASVPSGNKRFTVTRNKVNSEKYGLEYVFVSFDKADTELLKAIKAIRYGAMGRGKARWVKGKGWSIQAAALAGTVFSR